MQLSISFAANVIKSCTSLVDDLHCKKEHGAGYFFYLHECINDTSVIESVDSAAVHYAE